MGNGWVGAHPPDMIEICAFATPASEAAAPQMNTSDERTNLESRVIV